MAEQQLDTSGGSYGIDAGDESPFLGANTIAFLAKLQEIIDTNANSLGIVGGNFALRFFNGINIIVITSGPNTGVHFELDAEEPIHFVMTCEAWYLDNLLDATLGDDYDHEDAAEVAGLEVEGDIRIYDRFLGFAKGSSALDMRLRR